MREGNAGVALRYFDAETRLAARRDDAEVDALVAQMAATLHPDAELDLGPLSLSNRGIYRGLEQIAAFARDEMHEMWGEYRIDVEDVLEDDDRVVVVYTERLVARRTAAQVAARAADVYTLRDGRIAAIRFYREPEEALAAVGLRRAAAR
jgi:ketosteroid isomerase-like protein